jgi:hypothetical protein
MGPKMKLDEFLPRAVWAAVAVSAVVGLAGVVVLLRGDPTYLIQARTRAGMPYGAPAPVSFAVRAVSTMLLAAGLFVAGRRAVSDDGVGLRLPAVIGHALFVLDTAVGVGIGPVFPAFLAVAWLVLPLLGVMYSEAISELLEGRGPAPPWLIWGFCLLALAAPLVWALFFRSRAGS